MAEREKNTTRSPAKEGWILLTAAALILLLLFFRLFQALSPQLEKQIPLYSRAAP
ncbi:hypothetical protein [Paraflavitalea speifideaquila]|uniref:hypothetical protein n=1 Tax=Paraflavitalea speifideaquila TaxID=3076558 RepID=UPI0028EFD4B9|nr:hypothetical protein [Paraflavitalea speifideiaquila]